MNKKRCGCGKGDVCSYCAPVQPLIPNTSTTDANYHQTVDYTSNTTANITFSDFFKPTINDIEAKVIERIYNIVNIWPSSGVSYDIKEVLLLLEILQEIKKFRS